jgi:hypothetical protein
MANLILTDYNNSIYNFSNTFWVQADPFTQSKNVLNASYAAGGRNIGDGFPTPRVITLAGIIQGNSLNDFETKKRDFVFACLKGGYLSKSNDVVSRRLEIKFADFEWAPEEGQQYQEVSVIFTAEFPFWEDTTQTENENTVTGDDTLIINTTGSDFLIFPTIEIEADQGVDVPGILFRNNSDGGMSFTYNDNTFVQNDIARINCKEGTVKLNNGNRIENFNGAFLRLQPGSNTIIYEGPACTITFLYRKVYM